MKLEDNSMDKSTKGEAKQIVFKFTDLAALMIKDAGIHEGYWSVTVRFGINAANVALNNAPPVPTAIVPVLEIGIARDDDKGPLAVDAARVNPKGKTVKTIIKATKSKQKRK
jgi:hypothetical protein